MNARALSIGIGMLVGLIICLIVGVTANTNGKVKTEYDERQNAVRGKGFKYGFFTALILLGIFSVIEMFEVKIPAQQAVIYMFVIVVAVGVDVTYNIINDGYWGLNNNKKMYEIYFAIIGLVNFAIPCTAHRDSLYSAEEGLKYPVANILCGLLFIVLFAVIAVKNIISKREDADIDESEGEE